MTTYKTQVSRPGPDKHEWHRPWDGWLPGWHTIKTGRLAVCEATKGQYVASCDGADVRVVPVDKRDDED